MINHSFPSKLSLLLLFLLTFMGCGSKADEDHNKYYTKGIKLIAQGKQSRGLGYLKKAFKINPNHQKGAVALANAFLKSSQPRNASKVLSRYVSKNKGTADTWYLLGYSRFMERKHESAIESLDEALKINKFLPKAVLLLGKIYMEHKEPIAAKEIYLSISDKVSLGAPLAPILLKLSQLEMKGTEKDRANARVHLETALTLKPDYEDALSSLGLIYLNDKKPIKACQIFSKWVKRFPENGLAHLHYAHALLMDAKFKDAVTHYKKASKLRNDDILPLMGMVDAARALKDKKLIYSSLIKASAIDPSNVKVKWQLIPFYIEKELYTVAQKNATLCYNKYHRFMKYWEYKTEISIETGFYRLAYESWMRRLTLGAKSDDSFKKRAGILARQSGHFEISANYLNPLFKKHPNDREIKLNLALSLLQLKVQAKYTQGSKLLEEMSKTQWIYPIIWFALHQIQQGKLDQAKILLDRLKSMKKDREGLLFYYDVAIQYHKEKQEIDKYIALLKKQIPLARDKDEKQSIRAILKDAKKLKKEKREKK
jgi:tetratricopeptide (TPR) repeat protein